MIPFRQVPDARSTLTIQTDTFQAVGCPFRAVAGDGPLFSYELSNTGRLLCYEFVYGDVETFAFLETERKSINLNGIIQTLLQISTSSGVVQRLLILAL